MSNIPNMTVSIVWTEKLSGGRFSVFYTENGVSEHIFDSSFLSEATDRAKEFLTLKLQDFKITQRF